MKLATGSPRLVSVTEDYMTMSGSKGESHFIQLPVMCETWTVYMRHTHKPFLPDMPTQDPRNQLAGHGSGHESPLCSTHAHHVHHANETPSHMDRPHFQDVR